MQVGVPLGNDRQTVSEGRKSRRVDILIVTELPAGLESTRPSGVPAKLNQLRSTVLKLLTASVRKAVILCEMPTEVRKSRVWVQERKV
jgi:hypothetical protein